MNVEQEDQVRRACVVYAEKQDTLRDITTSLKMLNMEVRGAMTLAEARAQLIAGDVPSIVLVEGDAINFIGPGYELVESMKEHPDFSEIPVCLITHLAEDEEPPKDLPERISGFLKLPVEFPNFTREVKQFLSVLPEPPPRATPVPVEPKETQLVVEVHEESSPPVEALNGSQGHDIPSSGESSVKRLLDRRMVVAYGVQLAVLEELEQNEKFHSADVSQIPSIIAEVSQRVCAEFDFAELLGKCD